METRWTWMRRVTAVAAPLLVLAGIGSAVSLSGDKPDGADQVVAASGGTGAGFVPIAPAPAVPNAPAPVDSLPVPPPPPPPSIAAPTPSTTEAPPSTTTTTVATTTPTTVAASGPARVTLVNEYPATVRLILNGTTYHLAAGQQIAGVSIVPAESGNDTVTLERADDPTCGTGDAQGLFNSGRSYRFSIVVSRGTCGPDGPPGPAYMVAPV